MVDLPFGLDLVSLGLTLAAAFLTGLALGFFFAACAIGHTIPGGGPPAPGGGGA